MTDDRPTTECIHGVATVSESWVGLMLYDEKYQEAINDE